MALPPTGNPEVFMREVDDAVRADRMQTLATRYGMPVIALILGGVGVPPEGIGLILGVDRFLDMCRTTLNVVGDLVAATVISAVSGED